MVSLYWVTQDTAGIGNALGYATHNKKMRLHTSKLMRINDINSKYLLHIVPADQFQPVKGKINVLFTMFEMLDIPDTYKENLAKADYTIVPCQFCKDLFKPYTDKPIYVCGEGIEPTDYPFYQRKQPDYAKGERFRIYWSGAPNPRKGYPYMTKMIPQIEKIPQIELYIKTTMPKVDQFEVAKKAQHLLNTQELDHDTKRKLKALVEFKTTEKFMDLYMKTEAITKYGRFNNIVMDTRRVPFKELAQLYNDANLFAFPSSGEGWGLMGTEAMGTGLPVVAPMITGIKEYFDAIVGYPIDYTIVNRELTNYKLNARTYSPYYDDFVKQIFHVISNYEEALEKGKKASKRIHKKFTWERQAHVLKSIFEKIDKLESNK